MATVITDGILVTMNPGREIIRGGIRIEGRTISEVGAVIPQPGDEVVNARGMIVSPGLIQSHIHLCQTLFRGLADDMELLEWLRLRIWPLEAAHDPDSMYYSALLGCYELIRGGTTSIIDMASIHHTDSVFQAVDHSGIRYLGGKCLMDQCQQAELNQDIDTSLRESLDLLNKWNNRRDGRIRYAFCPRFAVSCSDRLLREMGQLAGRYGAFIHTHASESLEETAIVRREKGMENVEFLDEVGLCHERAILAHCIHLHQREIAILDQRRVNVAHCPSSNYKLASGLARIPEMLSRGINVGLGADGAPCNNRLDAFAEMRLAALIQKPVHGPRAMNAATVFEMATLAGARAMGMEKLIGSLEPGKLADVIIINNQGWHNLPNNDSSVYGQMVYQLQGLDVDTVIVDGRVLMRRGMISAPDINDVSRQCAAALERLAVRAGL